ncbi:hypothetical protein SAMN04488139_0076 [Pseudidiomarina donghaiensis]|nr:hypothetical protein SAMN04488139_0076 [Pseudidiomarina donghaiensis]
MFNASSAEQSKALKDKAMSFVRNGLVQAEAEQGIHRKQWFITSSTGEVTLYNALLLNAFFPDPKRVKFIFDDVRVRQESAEIVRSLVLDRQSLVGVTLLSPKSHLLIEKLFDVGEFDLRESKLPNPFHVLPQIALGSNIGLLQALLTQSASLDSRDSLLSAYLRQDWDEAMKHCSQIKKLAGQEESYRELIDAVERGYQEAQEFDQLIDIFKNQ